MNEQLQSKLVEILTGIQTATKAAGDFALEQLPDIAMQYVAYGRAIYTVGVGFGLLLIAIAMFSAWRFVFKDEEAWTFPMIVGGVVGFLIATANIGPMLMVWLAPKVWLLQELAKLVK